MLGTTTSAALAQSQNEDMPVAGAGKVHGHITNAIGEPMTSGEVKLTQDRESEASKRKFTYTFPVDKNGDFKGDNIKPGDYLLVYFQDNKSVDFIDHVDIKNGVDTLQNVDMTREEYQKTLTEEQKKQYAEIKKKNAGAIANNAKVANVNALLLKGRDETKNKNFDAAIADLTQATQVKGDESIIWNALGDAQYGAKKYDEAITSYQKSIDLNAASKKPMADVAASDYSQMGLAYAMSGKPTDAMQAFEKAAAAEPAKAGSYYYNAAAVLYNAGKTDEAGAAIDKAIAADPNKAESYYIKGQTLIGKSTVKNNKIVPPPGTVEAYEKYLELDPNGRHAADVKGILAGFDETVVNEYRARRGKKK
ncbi:MAG: tetratricopeptide repeat protein [Acidobacteria bacterium]|nr:tetratricopeptide repeat protein [Acidobacteriota bacterium]